MTSRRRTRSLSLKAAVALLALPAVVAQRPEPVPGRGIPQDHGQRTPGVAAGGSHHYENTN